MSTFRASNPMLTEAAFEPQGKFGNFALERSRVMTVQGAVNASLILMGLCIASAVAVWSFLQPVNGHWNPLILPVFFGGWLVSVILCLVCSFKPSVSPYVGWVVALGQGCIAGTASILWTSYAQASKSGTVTSLGTGLVLQAVLLTSGIAVSMLIAYRTGLIKATEKFKLGMAAAMGGLCLLCMASWILSFFGMQIPYIWDSGPIGIAFSGFVVVLASLNLVLDFDRIRQGAEHQLPRHMEWYSAIGLLVTLVWLYISILRLLAKLQDRR